MYNTCSHNVMLLCVCVSLIKLLFMSSILFIIPQTLAQSTIGDAGLVLVPLMVAVSTIGAATAAMYSGSRVTFTTARDGNMIGTLSLLHNKFQTPIMALIVQVNHTFDNGKIDDGHKIYYCIEENVDVDLNFGNFAQT